MFALVGLSLFCVGCGEKKPETPPPGVDAETPALDVEGGEVVTPGDDTKEEGDAKKE
jgi:hypothetical protein